MTTLRTNTWLLVLVLSGCSSEGPRIIGDKRGPSVTPPAQAGSHAAGATELPDTGAGSAASPPLVVNSSNSLTVHVEDIQGLTLEIVTVNCAGACADITAVARGGNPPYTFAWEDGSTTAQRHVCLSTGTTLTVTATDTALETLEFSYEAQKANASVAASVSRCVDAGVPPPPPGEFCLDNPSLEGTPGRGLIDRPTTLADGWTECIPSPDVGPTSTAATIPPSDGKTYVGMASNSTDLQGGRRGPESTGGRLCGLDSDASLTFTVDLARGGISYPSRGHLEIWGGTEICQMDELLWKSPVIENVEVWNTYCGTLSSSKRYPYVRLIPMLETNSAGELTYIMVDNFRPKANCE